MTQPNRDGVLGRCDSANRDEVLGSHDSANGDEVLGSCDSANGASGVKRHLLKTNHCHRSFDREIWGQGRRDSQMGLFTLFSTSPVSR